MWAYGAALTGLMTYALKGHDATDKISGLFMTNPFEDETAQFLILTNKEGQYSLWPQFADIPPGWELRFGPDQREACLKYVEEHWVDMRPLSLVAAMNAHPSE